MKMVDVEVLERVVKDKADRGKHFAYIGGLHAVVGFIKNGEIPTVDAVPVVHGDWTAIEDDWNEETIYQCSVCKEEFVTIDGTPPENLWNYCPNCGAKMDGGNENG